MMTPRIPIDRHRIAAVVGAFYHSVRQDRVLGPVFAAHVTDWPTHEEKITRFWANALLFERSYDGNPMRAHIEAGNVYEDHFPIWLALFDETLRTHLSPEQSRQWSHLARRIGRGLSMGVREYHRPPDAIPDLSSGI